MFGIFKIFSAFTDDQEKKCYNFLQGLTPRSDRRNTASRARRILQEDVVRMMMIVEWKYKGYRTLTKKYRQRCYDILPSFLADFKAYKSEKNPQTEADYLRVVSEYLHQHRPVEYRAGSSFDKLIKDPTKETLVGDCNQLTTLYVFLFSLEYEITSLELKFLPGHVCLHHKGMDYETTSGDITTYEKFSRIGPVEEIIAVNILDVSDHAETTHPLPAENKVQCAEVAFTLSGEPKIAQQNLDAAYHNMAVKKMNDKNFNAAATWAGKTKDKQFLDVVLHNEAVYNLNHKHYNRARKVFSLLHDVAGVKAVDQTELNNLVAKLKGCKTTEDYKYKKTVIYKIKKLAITLHDHEMQKFCTDILKQI